MFSKNFKTAAATNQSGAMVTGNHFKTAMDDRDHFKNGANPKSLMSRGKILQRTFLIFTVFWVSVASAFAQDIIVTKDSKRIEAKVTEVNEDNIKYIIFDNQDGPVYTISKSNIATILYEGGRVEIFEDENKKTATPPGQTPTSEPNPTKVFNCTPKVTERNVSIFAKALPSSTEKLWNSFFEENENLGFKKKMITFQYLPYRSLQNEYRGFPSWTNGLYINYDDQLIKFREGNNIDNEKYYIEIPFQCLYSVKMDKLTVTKGFAWGGDFWAVSNSSESIRTITIQITIHDPKGGLKTLELRMMYGPYKRGTAQANAAEKCAIDIINELRYIIDKYT